MYFSIYLSTLFWDVIVGEDAKIVPLYFGFCLLQIRIFKLPILMGILTFCFFLNSTMCGMKIQTSDFLVDDICLKSVEVWLTMNFLTLAS